LKRPDRSRPRDIEISSNAFRRDGLEGSATNVSYKKHRMFYECDGAVRRLMLYNFSMIVGSSILEYGFS
jgi:hypothetical protein